LFIRSVAESEGCRGIACRATPGYTSKFNL